MAIGEVAGSTVSTALASTQLNSAQRGAQQAGGQTNPEGASSTNFTQSVTAAASSGDANNGSTGDPSRGSRLDITV